MTRNEADATVRLDLNNPTFQKHLFALQKPERHAALNTLDKLLRMTWTQVHRDSGLKWEKIASIQPPADIEAIYSLRISRCSRRTTAFREGNFLRLLTIAPDHDGTYGKK